jgi:hypothetical protein
MPPFFSHATHLKFRFFCAFGQNSVYRQARCFSAPVVTLRRDQRFSLRILSCFFLFCFAFLFSSSAAFLALSSAWRIASYSSSRRRFTASCAARASLRIACSFSSASRFAASRLLILLRSKSQQSFIQCKGPKPSRFQECAVGMRSEKQNL